MFSLILYMFKIQLVLFYFIHKILSREIISNNLFVTLKFAIKYENLLVKYGILKFRTTDIPEFQNYEF